jgi:hypothetical protein
MTPLTDRACRGSYQLRAEPDPLQHLLQWSEGATVPYHTTTAKHCSSVRIDYAVVINLSSSLSIGRMRVTEGGYDAQGLQNQNRADF